jgi:hypothetical protein
MTFKTKGVTSKQFDFPKLGVVPDGGSPKGVKKVSKRGPYKKFMSWTTGVISVRAAEFSRKVQEDAKTAYGSNARVRLVEIEMQDDEQEDL